MSEERLRIGNCSIRQHGTAQHPRNFKNSLVFREFFYCGDGSGSLRIDFFGYKIVGRTFAAT